MLHAGSTTGRRRTAVAGLAVLWLGFGHVATAREYDVLIQGGTIYDGRGGRPYVGDVAIDGDRIAFVGPGGSPLNARRVVDATGRAVAPGFINMISHVEESLLADGRALSDLSQGVTLEVLGEGTSMGPTTDAMAKRDEGRQGDIKYTIDWRSFEGYLEEVERRGISPNVASFIGAATPRDYVLGEGDVQPTPQQLARMQALVRQAMEQGALGVASALIYTPGLYARTPELIALATQAGRCGGIYITHMRSEGDRLLEGVDETIEIARDSNAPADIYHMKAAGQANWPKLDAMVAKIEAARAMGVRITADMYTYTAAATGLDAAMPPWVREGGLEAWIARLDDHAVQARVIGEMRNPESGYENMYLHAGAQGTLLLAFKNEKLKYPTGKTLADVSRLRGTSPEQTAIDLVREDGSRVGVAYFAMSDQNVRRQVALPWMSFGSDEAGPAPEGIFLKSGAHPRAYGNFARLLAKYVREDEVLTLADAIHRMTGMPASNLSLADRGLLKAGDFADVVVFDPATIQDHATYQKPHQLATGVDDVLVNGVFALENGRATGAHTGRFVRGRAWTGYKQGGCRDSASRWAWSR